MDIAFAALICWDFVDEADESELLSGLGDLYGEEPESYSGPKMGGGGWFRKVVGNEENRIESETDFTSVRTIVETQVDGLIDVTTIATLSDEQINEVVKSEHRRGHESLRLTLEEYLKQLPSLINHDDTGFSGVTYAEWDGDEPLIPDEEEVELERIVERLNDEMQTLVSFGFQTSGLCSLVLHNVFVAPPISMQPYDGLAAIRRGPHDGAEQLDDLILDPGWYHEIKGFRHYYRLKFWVEDRWNRLYEFESQADAARASLSELPTNAAINDVLNVSEEIQSLQTDFTQFKTRYDTEYEGHAAEFKEPTRGTTSTFGIQFDTPLPRIDIPDEFLDSEEETTSLVEYFDEGADHTLNDVSELAARINRTITSLVNSIESRTRLAATDENLQLQSRVTRLTQVLTGLTIVLVVLTVMLVGLEIL